jgi:predicted RNA-binding protein with PIN domain
MEHLSLQGMVVFDSGKQNILPYGTHNTSGHLEIVFSPKNTAADDYIIELLSFSLPRSTTILVTSDKPLSNQAKALKVKTLPIPSFLSLLTSKEKTQSKKSESKPTLESSSQIERLRQIFEDRYNHPD